jgi:signal transduction histidine kinase/FixJ family two-component response regulator
LKTPRKIWATLLAAFGLVVVGSLGLFWAYGQIEHAAETRQHTHTVAMRAQEWLSELKDAETGQRGYALTGDEDFLEPYLKVRDELAGDLQKLRQLTLIPEARAHLEAMGPLLGGKLAHMAQVIALRREQDAEAVAALVAQGEGKQLMNAIRVEMTAFRQIEEASLARHDAQFHTRLRFFFSLLVLASLLALVMALVFAWLIYRDSRHQLKHLVHLETQHLLAIQQETSRELEQAKTLAEKANLAKSEFLSNMSHELRSPLNAILGFAQLMESDTPPPTPEQKASIEQILHAGWFLLDLINEILDLALVESGKLTLTLEPISLPEVLLECQEMVEPLAQKRSIQMTFPVFTEPCFITADRTRLKQVLINLLSNSIKYNRDGGAVIVDCADTASGHLRISVKDTGDGLAPEMLAQLFQAFNRLGREVTAEEGTGIGLVVSKRLVELMQGKIGATSQVGVGSVFWIELLHDRDTHSEHHRAAKKKFTPMPISRDFHKSVVLYVEDNEANLKLIQQLISRFPGIQLLTAKNAQDGIALALGCVPDVIVMDINLPGMNGIEAMQILNQDPLTSHIPIVALSANAMPLDVATGLTAGFYKYLTKPINVSAFMETLTFSLEYAAKRRRSLTSTSTIEPLAVLI